MLCLVYQIKNDLNRKLYIGVTNQSLHCRMQAHVRTARKGDQKPLYVAMRELGIDHFCIELLATIEGERHQAESKETEYIKLLGTAYPQGYNLRDPLTNEQAAIIRYDFYNWPHIRYAKAFHIPASTVSQIRNHTWLYSHVTREHLPAREQDSQKTAPEWIRSSEAAAILSLSSGRTIAPGYVRQLAHASEIRSKVSDDGAYLLIHRGDCESYIVRNRQMKAGRV